MNYSTLLRGKKKVRLHFAALKVDLSKAYDRLNWNFIEATLQKMGFSQQWTQLMMQCVSIVTYNILVNGAPTEKFKPNCGIRQGDPLSPYIFIICANILSCMLQDLEAKGMLKVVEINKRGLPISHLMFADDIIIFYKVANQTTDKLNQTLQNFWEMSGQKINWHQINRGD